MRGKWKGSSLIVPALAVLLGCCLATAPLSATGAAAVSAQVQNDDAKLMAAFRKRADDYAALRRDVEGRLPRRKAKATPEEVVHDRQALVAAIRDARSQAQPGDIFTADVQPVLRRLLTQVFKKPQGGASAKEAVNEENPRGTKVAVNQPYPDGTPVTTMPPDVLANLPPLPEALHYHFIGRTLILLDSDARLIVDYMPNAMP